MNNKGHLSMLLNTSGPHGPQNKKEHIQYILIFLIPCLITFGIILLLIN